MAIQNPLLDQQITALGDAHRAMMGGNIASAEGYQAYQDALKRAGGVSEAVDTTAAMNPGVEQAKKAVVAEGEMTPEQIAARSMEGVDKSNQLASSGSMLQASRGLGGPQDEANMAAIANRQSKIYGSSLNNIQQNASINSKLQAIHQRQAALAGMASVEDLKTQAANTQLVKFQNDQAARNATLNAILGLGGAIAGGVISGGAGFKGLFTAKGYAGMAPGSAMATGAGKAIEGGGGNTETHALDSGGHNSASYFGR